MIWTRIIVITCMQIIITSNFGYTQELEIAESEININEIYLNQCDWLIEDQDSAPNNDFVWPINSQDWTGQKILEFQHWQTQRQDHELKYLTQNLLPCLLQAQQQFQHFFEVYNEIGEPTILGAHLIAGPLLFLFGINKIEKGKVLKKGSAKRLLRYSTRLFNRVGIYIANFLGYSTDEVEQHILLTDEQKRNLVEEIKLAQSLLPELIENTRQEILKLETKNEDN